MSLRETFGVFGVVRRFEASLKSGSVHTMSSKWRLRRRDVGSGATFLAWVQRGRLKGSTGWVQVRAASVATWVDGLIQRSTSYLDIDEARAAAERLAEELGIGGCREDHLRVILFGSIIYFGILGRDF